MLVGVGRIVLDFYDNQDVKIKRREIENLCKSLKRKFNISIMEVGEFEDPEICAVGFAVVIPENWKKSSAKSFIETILKTIDESAFTRVTIEDWDLLTHGEY